VKIVNLWEPLPSVLVEGYSVLRATTMAVALEAEPPGWLMPPDVEAGRWKSEAR